jgi:hypothetical protein
VIDADVVRAAGGKEATHPTSQHCRDFLDAVLTICHGMALSQPLYQEWRTHESGFARGWRRSMLGHRKFTNVGDVMKADLRSAIVSLPLTEREVAAALKDVHLVEAALAADRVVVSCDKEASSILRKAARHIPALRDIMWVNPTEDHDHILRWLSAGAGRRDEFLLGS